MTWQTVLHVGPVGTGPKSIFLYLLHVMNINILSRPTLSVDLVMYCESMAFV